MNNNFSLRLKRVKKKLKIKLQGDGIRYLYVLQYGHRSTGSAAVGFHMAVLRRCNMYNCDLDPLVDLEI